MRMKRGQGRRNKISEQNGGVITHSELTKRIINSVSALMRNLSRVSTLGLQSLDIGQRSPMYRTAGPCYSHLRFLPLFAPILVHCWFCFYFSPSFSQTVLGWKQEDIWVNVGQRPSFQALLIGGGSGEVMLLSLNLGWLCP